MEQRLTSLRRKFSSLHIKIRVMNQYRLINIQKNTHIKIQRIKNTHIRLRSQILFTI